MGKRLYIKSWTYDIEGQRNYLRAVYDLGDKRNESKPKVDRAEYRRRSDNSRAQRMCNSVFALGTPKKSRIAKSTGTM